MKTASLLPFVLKEGKNIYTIACLCVESLDICIRNNIGYAWGRSLGGWGQGQEEAYFSQ